MKPGKLSALSPTFCQTSRTSTYQIILKAPTVIAGAISKFGCRLTKNARLLSNISSSTNFRSSILSLIPYHFSSPVDLTFKLWTSVNFSSSNLTTVSHLFECGIKNAFISTTPTDDYQNIQTLLEACQTLQVLRFGLFPGTAQLLGSIPSSSVSLIHVDNPLQLGGAPTTYSDSWPWESLGEFEHYLSILNDDILMELMEFTYMGVSIRGIAQRFSDRHPGLKTRVRATLPLTESEVRAVESGEVPLYKARVEEELGNYVDLEIVLITLPDQEYPELEPDAGADT